MPIALFVLLSYATFSFSDVHPSYHLQRNAWFRYKYCVNDTCFRAPDSILFFFSSINMNGDGRPHLVRSGCQNKKDIKANDTLWAVEKTGRTFLYFEREPGKELQVGMSNQDERFHGNGQVILPDSNNLEIRLIVQDIDSPSVHVGKYNYSEYYKLVHLPEGVKLMRK